MSDKPTETGWYWIDQAPAGQASWQWSWAPRVCVVLVNEPQGNHFDQALCVWVPMMDYQDPLPDGMRWVGPLVSPF